MEATRPAICYRNHHLRRRDTDMDDIRESFSRLKKGVKHRLTGRKRKADKTGDGGLGGRVDPLGSIPRPEPHVVTGSGREPEQDESNADDGNAGPSAVADEKKSGWTSTTSASAKLVLRGVRDSADAFGPLRSVVGGLCFILENCEVRSFSHSHTTHNTYRRRSVRRRISKE